MAATPTLDLHDRAPAEAPALSRRDEVAFCVFTTWCIVGLYLDGWSHNVAKPETFFTPWHGLLYSGFGSAVGWSMYEANRLRLEGRPRSPVQQDRANVLGTVLVAVGMVGDFAWHTIFGVERSIEALLSPTHLTLMTGGLLLASGPLRASIRQRPDRDAPRAMRELLPALVSAALSTALVAFFLQFSSAFTGRSVAEFMGAHGLDDAAQASIGRGVLSILVTSTLLVAVVAVIARSWRTPPGAHALVLGVVALFGSGLHAFDHVLLVVPAVLAGVAADAVSRAGRRDLAPVIAAGVLWPAWFVVVALTADLGWSANAIGGSAFLAVLAALGVRALAFDRAAGRPQAPSRAPAPSA